MLIDALPLKLKKDVLIDVHYQTLSKVSLFKDCERTMLFDLICKLKPVLFLPGALICEKVIIHNLLLYQLFILAPHRESRLKASRTKGDTFAH